MSTEGTFQNLNNANNFDPNALANETSTVIMFVVVTDVSPSIEDYVIPMNDASDEVFMKELKNCHRKNDIVLKNIIFSEKVEHKSGFMPIINLQDDYLTVKPKGSGTALYQAVLEALEHSVKYREDLEAQGIEVRTCIFIITDGEDNSSPIGATKKIKDIVTGLRKNEAWISSFTINMLGVGRQSSFEHSCVEMGLDPKKMLSTIGATAKEIRQQMGVISQSVSSSNASNAVSF